ncbi:3'(2'),5'-bisphosphate nucleotidase CysQ [Aureispira anguillae]|uniref:3'(2'),5'-bisphosphate nucleotidase CysQ n=1 Tax=Aureispira anguillae TaxID=2864201 RepID=A0A915YID3_9BACT|nr:3'(2'),5'-bisphosphate nucleotidase CysQ [Aureispira anguillae]BDS13564.1 3'(2'),5'-bisphosphate nucleotidase CysQ [Aureispira anguillae]
MTYKDLIPELCQIATDAGLAILDIYKNCEGIEIIKKADDSPLTAADQASNAVICAGLEQLPIQYPIISEENKAVPFEVRKNYDYYWLVDPLDGTKEFIKRNGEFTVNIALVHAGKVVLGVVYAPVLDELYWAADGDGAFLKTNGETKAIHAPKFTMKDKGINVVCSRSHLNEETKAFIEQLDAPNLVSKGSSLKFLQLATGQAHLYPRVAPTMEWDTAAAQIVLEEAGGKVLQYNTTDAVIYNKENMLNPYFVAYANLVE